MKPKFTSTLAIVLVTLTLISLGAGLLTTVPAVMAQSEQANPTHHLFLPAIVDRTFQTVAQLPLEQMTDTQVTAAAPSPTGATITSDLADYPPGATVTLTGAGWQPGEVVDIFVNDDANQQWSLRSDPDPVANSDGAFRYSFQLPYTFIANYSVIATGAASGVATTTFTDANSSADIDQCANDPAPSPNTDGCSASASDWVNGNLGASKAVYLEGDAIPYRLRFDNLSLASHTVTIEWDTTKSSTHALDYLTTFNRTVATADPCLGVSGCNPSVFTTFSIPADPQVTGAGVTPVAGNFTLYGGTITAVSAYSYPDGAGFTGDKSARITLTFTANQANPVLAWGGHISARADWGANNSAVAISGSPYHTRLIDLDGSGGNQDRSLSADAVIFPASITIIKDATPNGATSFAFTASPAPLSNFALVDDGTTANTKVFANLTTFQDYSVVETVPSNWSLTNIACSVTTPNGGTQTTNVGTATATIKLEEGENVTCTFTNSRNTGSLQISKVFDPLTSGFTGKFSISYDCDDGTAHDGTVQLGAGESTTISDIPVGASCTVSEATLPTAPSGWTFGTPAISPAQPVVINTTTTPVQVTVTNTISRDQGYLKISKVFDPLTSGFSGNFTIVYNCGGGDQSVTLAADASTTVGPFDTGVSCTVSEPALPTAPTGWSFGTPSVAGSPATIVKGNQAAAVEVTVINTISRDRGSLTITKSVTGAPSSFTGSIDVHVVCTGDGGTYDRTINIPTPGSVTITDIPTSQCTVTETGRSTPPAGYSWGASTITGSPADVTKNGTVTVNITNVMTRDVGSLKITKSVTGDVPPSFSQTFTFDVLCTLAGSPDLTYNNLAIDYPTANTGTQANIPTGYSCTVTEDTRTDITGYTWGAAIITGNPAVIAAKETEYTVAVENPISRDTGSLQILKTLSNPDGASVPASFTVNYDCGTGYTGSVTVAPGTPATVNNIPTGNTCTVTEVAPAPILNYTWGTITYAPPSVMISTKGGTFSITVGNTITRDRGALTILKKVSNDNGGTATVGAFGLTTSAGSLTFDSGSVNGTTTTYTSQKLTVVTGNYTLKENDVYGYSEGTWSCTGAAGTVVPTFNNGSVAVGKNEDVTCTITNDDQPGTIIIIKNAKPTQGQFAFTATGAGYNSFSLTGATTSGGNRNSQTLNAGSYTVQEGTQLGWTLTGIGGASDPSTPYNCVVTGTGGSTGVGNLNTGTATINLKNGDTVTCTFENTGVGATRTQGFWATHPQLAEIAWFGGTRFGHTFPGVASVAGISDNLICGKPVDTLGKVMGAFWSDIAKTSTGKKRTALDQARMQLLQQLIAAELNASAFGSVPSGGTGKFAQWESALCGNNTSAIKTAQQGAASFNTAGDSSTFTPGTSADSKTARNIANIKFWDTIPPTATSASVDVEAETDVDTGKPTVFLPLIAQQQ